MLKPTTRALVLAIAIFVGLSLAKFLSKDTITIKTFIGPFAGAVVAGLVTYFSSNALSKRKKDS